MKEDNRQDMQDSTLQQSVLIVDDEPVNRLLLQVIVTQAGYQCQLAPDAVAAREMLAQYLPDLILLDVMMPGMDGFELTGILRQEARTRHLPIILVTALNDRANMLCGLAAGADDFVTKPVNQDELRLRMRNLLRMKAYQDQVLRHNETLEEEVDRRTEQLAVEHAALQAAHTQLQDTQEQLVRNEKLAGIGQLAAGVAHEINNPVGYVSSNLNSLGIYVTDLLNLINIYALTEPLLPEDAPEYAQLRELKDKLELDYLVGDIQAVLTESKEGLRRVKKIVQDLKEFSHVGSGDWECVDLHVALESTLNIVWNELKYKADVVREYGELPEIRCLPPELAQVWMNLLVNAAHAIPERGTIHVRSGQQSEHAVWVEVEDNGGGIEPEHKSRLFDPFFTTKPVGKGTGLGLSISHAIVQKHGGSIEVDSEVGRGTRFRIVLPVKGQVAADQLPDNTVPVQ